MKELMANGKKITYEIYGETGDYLLLLNGLMMTDKSWLPLMPTLKENFRVICLNLHDQGCSEKMDGPYTNEIQVDAVLALIDHLGIDKINLIGTSYGGAVGLYFGVKYPDRLKRMMLLNSICYAEPYLLEIGRLWQKGAASYCVDTYYDSFAPNIYAPRYFEQHYEAIYKRKEMLRGLPKEYFDSIIRLAQSAENFDLRHRLREITAPVLVVGCDEDYVTPLSQQKFLADNIPNARLITMPETGHGAIYEKSDLVVMLMIGWFRDITTLPVF